MKSTFSRICFLVASVCACGTFPVDVSASVAGKQYFITYFSVTTFDPFTEYWAFCGNGAFNVSGTYSEVGGPAVSLITAQTEFEGSPRQVSGIALFDGVILIPLSLIRYNYLTYIPFAIGFPNFYCPESSVGCCESTGSP